MLNMCAALALTEGENRTEDATAARTRGMAKLVHAGIKAKGTADRSPLAHIVRYPTRPADLPEQMQAHAYGANRPSADWYVPGLDAVAQNVGYRSTHASLRDHFQLAQRYPLADTRQQAQMHMMQQSMVQH